MHANPSSGRTRIELKVWVTTAVTFLISCVVAVAEAVADNPAVLDGMPAWARFLILAIVPAVVVFGAGYAAPHTDRPDLTEEA